MAEYISVDEFDQGWNFFTKKIWGRWGKFPCSKFSCSGCDDWLDSENQNRNSNNFTTRVLEPNSVQALDY